MASTFDKLPVDLLSGVLQLLPAKELCRLRAVCRSWRSLTSDAAFIKAHTERHKETLLLAKFQDDKTHVYVVDLCGNVIKRISGADGPLKVLHTRLDRACLATKWNTCHVLNPATGGIHHVPPLVANSVIQHNCRTFFVLGWVASTREYKLPRSLSTFRLSGVQVLTINGGTDHAQWRQRQGPRLAVDACSGVVVDGVVYFLTGADSIILPLYHGRSTVYRNAGTPADSILSFDLAREEWRRDLHGPSSTGNLTSGQTERSRLTLADLNGSLVLAHHPHSPSVMDLWFLLDFENRLWVKQYSIRTDSVSSSLQAGYHLIPLLVLNDGMLVIHLAPTGLLFICHPGSNTFTQVVMRHLDSIAVYTGSLLSPK